MTISNPSKEDLENYPCPPYKIIILDEADSMTNDAQSALRRTMENYSGVTRFCLICNYITRIIDPLASRCSKFRFRLLNNSNALNRLKYIVGQEEIALDNEDVLEEVLNISNGDLRKAITYLQSAARLHASFNNRIDANGDIEMVDADTKSKITKDSVQEIAGVLPEASLDQIISAIESLDTRTILQKIEEIVLQGWSAQQVVDQLHDKFILNDSLESSTKNKIAKILFETDRKLNNGTDEHIQLLNLCLQIKKVL